MRITVPAALLLVAAAAVPSEAAETRELVLFTIGVRAAPEQLFVVGTDDPDVIDLARAQLELPVADRRLFPSGALAAGHGGFNLGWGWHLVPGAWGLVEASIELCDGIPAMVDADLGYWIGAVGTFCPWTGYVLAEATPYPPEPPVGVEVVLEPVATGFANPVSAVAAGDGSGRLFVVEKAGRVRLATAGGPAAEPFLDLTDRVRSSGSEQGLLGLAFSPDFASSGRLYVSYTDLQGDSVISRLTVGGDPGRVDAATEEVLLRVSQPFSNHNGGHLAFGPDGMLWIGPGDGGSAGDPRGNGQDPSTLLGSMLRIDVSTGSGYAVPDDNPFVGDPDARDEIWAIGLRNPWRFAFDRATGDLYVADVGQNRFEEVTVLNAAGPGGRNLGWNRMEGFACYPDGPCDSAGLTLPAVVYGHGEGCSVTGGVVVRDPAEPELDGVFLFADFCSGRIWALAPGGASGWTVAEVGRHDGNLAGFGEAEDGAVYAVDIGSGELLRVRGEPRPPGPRRPSGRVR